MTNQAENLNNSQSSGSGNQAMNMLTSVFQRAKAVLMDPAGTWQVIKAESTTIKDIYQNYLVILAVIPAIASLIALSIIGIQIPLYGTFRAPFFGTLISQVINLAVSLGMVYVAALVIEKLGPKFDAKPDTLSAFKLVAYSMTPAWVAGIFVLLPWGIAALASLAGAIYAIYVFLQGVQPMTGVPDNRKTGYVAVSALVIIVLGIIVGFIVANVTAPAPGHYGNPQGLQSEQLKQFEESMKALQKAMPNAN